MQKKEFIKRAIAEDVGRGDLFARIGHSKAIKAYIISKSEGIFAGREYIELLAGMYDISFDWHFNDGDRFETRQKLVEIKADSKILLTLERTILDIVLHASSIATLTAQYVDALKGSNVKLLDTRKTRPLLRVFEKYAVRCGGGLNHRMGLDDCLMLKDTHLKTIDNLESFMQEVRSKIPFTSKVEIECESLEAAKKAMSVGADIVMCDNMPINMIEEVVAYKNTNYPATLIEASGNITLANIASFAKTNVDAISTGSIIHQAKWIDLSMKISE